MRKLTLRVFRAKRCTMPAVKTRHALSLLKTYIHGAVALSCGRPAGIIINFIA